MKEEMKTPLLTPLSSLRFCGLFPAAAELLHIVQIEGGLGAEKL